MSRSRAWCFTLNNYVESDVDAFTNSAATYGIIGREIGESGTPHLQGYLYFKNDLRLSSVRLICGRSHWEIRKGNHVQARDYCKKENNFIEFGTEPNQGKRTDLELAIQEIRGGTDVRRVAEMYSSTFVRYGRGLRDLALTLQEPYEHNDVRGLWFVGRPGSGKSAFARTFNEFYLKAQNKWFDGYGGEETIILDDLDQGGKCLGHLLKIWTDRYACTGETKGGTIHLRHKRFIVTSNYRISDLFGDDPEMLRAIVRRFVVRDFSLFPFVPESRDNPPAGKIAPAPQGPVQCFRIHESTPTGTEDQSPVLPLITSVPSLHKIRNE